MRAHSRASIGQFIKWKHAKRRTGLLREARYLLLGLVSLAAVTGLYFWLDAPLVSTAFTFLVVLVLLSLVSNFSSVIVLSFIAVGCLNYFFAPPIYSFRVDTPQDLSTLIAFVITSLIVNFLVAKVQTERKRAQDEHEKLRQLESDLAHMNRVSMMGELAASLSHEITQPIASARNNACAARNFLDKQELGEVREALGCVLDDAERAGEIVDRIRDHIKKAPPRKDHFDLNAAINEVTVLVRSAIMQNGVSVQTRLAEELFPVHGDRVQLQQVVLNLLLNAVEAMGSVDGGPRELLISTEQEHKSVVVAVRDSGPGIDPTRMERVFDAFYTTKPKGVGMGLSICRSIIDAHGGRLWADANEPRGTVFQFTLPCAES